MKEVDEYLEKKGAKYFVTLTMIFYVIGTAIFNIYLRKLGIAEFDLVKLRYMFVGITFGVISFIPVALFFGIRKIIKLLKKNVKPQTKREKVLFWKRFEHVIWILVLPWMVVYSWYIFPEVPSGFGGAKPVVARLVGKSEEIKGINELIAFETGVPVDKLPFELATEESELAIGANVMILDQNSERLFLLLTKELYLSSTSSLARDLLSKTGKDAKELTLEETKNFNVKPLIVDAGKIQGITLSLYEPPEVLTNDDIKVAAAVIASSSSQETTEIVQNFIAQKAPEVAPKVLEVVQKQVEKNRQVASKPTTTPENPNTSTENPGTENNTEEVEQPTEENDTQELERAFEEIFDSSFLRFRAEIFGQATTLCNQERRTGKSSASRIDLVKSISGRFVTEFPEAWKTLAEENYLVQGQKEEEFGCKLVRIFQGANDAYTIVQRLNDEEVAEGPDFNEVVEGAVDLFEKSSQVNTAGDRKYMSRILSNYFSQKAKQEVEYWSNTKYIYDGREDEDYFANMRIALTETDSWETFGQKLTEFQVLFEEKQQSVLPEEGGEEELLQEEELEIVPVEEEEIPVEAEEEPVSTEEETVPVEEEPVSEEVEVDPAPQTPSTEEEPVSEEPAPAEETPPVEGE